jgi:O-antigen/teichoic acid export membrane protein
LASGVSDASGTWILGVTTNVNAVGAYSRAWNLTSRLSELNWRITEMLLPTLVQRRAAGDSEGFERVLVDSLRYAAFGLLLPAAVAGGAAESVMHVFGDGFGAAAPALRWLLFLPLLQTLTAIQGTALMATDRPLVTAFVQTLRLVITLACGVALSLALGISGMAITAAGGALLSFIAYTILLSTRVGTPKPALAHARLLAGLCAAYAAGFASAHLIEREIAGIAGLVCALAVGSAAYLIVGLGACRTTERDRARLRALLDRIGRRRALSAEIPGAA